MNKLNYLFFVLLLTSCSTRQIIFELRAQQQITTACAYLAIKGLGEYDFVENKENEIVFFNKSYGGSLLHGGETEFVSYDIKLKTSPLLGPNLKKISDTLVDAVYAKCLPNIELDELRPVDTKI